MCVCVRCVHFLFHRFGLFWGPLLSLPLSHTHTDQSALANDNNTPLPGLLHNGAPHTGASPGSLFTSPTFNNPPIRPPQLFRHKPPPTVSSDSSPRTPIQLGLMVALSVSRCYILTEEVGGASESCKPAPRLLFCLHPNGVVKLI